MMKKLFCGLTLAIALAISANAQTTYTQTNTIAIGTPIGTAGGCPGRYYGLAKITNAASFWITPPAGTTQGTLVDMSGYSAPYKSSVVALRKRDSAIWCSTNGSVTFPAQSTNQYQLTVYVNQASPTNATSQIVNWGIVWQ